MIRKNLFLLEYMVLQRIEKDTKRLEAIKNIGQLLEDGKIDEDTLVLDNNSSLIKRLESIKERPLSPFEIELVDEIIQITKE